MTEDLSMATLIAAVETAREALQHTEDNENAARRNATDARNRYNKAGKALDAAMASMRGVAPRGTDWWTKEHGTGNSA